MFFNMFKKKKEKVDSYPQSPFDSRYYMSTAPYIERKDDVYDYAQIYPNNESNYDSDDFLSFCYDLICKLAENNNLCYYVEYDENLPEHKEVIEHLQNNFENGDVYSITYSKNEPILTVYQSKPTVEIMAKAGKDGLNYASGVEAYIYKGIPEFNKNIINNAVRLLGADKQYMMSISVDDHTGFMIFEYDKTQISFDDIRKKAEKTAPEYGKYIEVSGNNKLDYDSEHYCPVYKMVIHPDLCYDSLMCLNRCFKVSSTKELAEVKDIDEARVICKDCPYSVL